MHFSAFLFIFCVMIAFVLGLYAHLFVAWDAHPKAKHDDSLARDAVRAYFWNAGLKELYRRSMVDHPGDGVRIHHDKEAHVAMLRLARDLGMDAEELMNSRRDFWNQP